MVFSFLAFLCVLATGCISIEQEVFLNADGSGDFVLHISVPDLPEDVKSSAKEMAPGKDPSQNIEEMKKELLTALPPTVKISETKVVRQNGVQGFYIVLQFKELKDVTSLLSNFGKDSLKDSDIKNRPEWSVDLKKLGSKWNYKSSFYLNLDDDKKAEKPDAKKTAEEQQAAKAGDDFGKQLLPLLLGTVRLRFVLHSPSPITDTNADIVLRGNTAVWNCSFASFVKDKKPIQMRATF